MPKFWVTLSLLWSYSFLFRKRHFYVHHHIFAQYKAPMSKGVCVCAHATLCVCDMKKALSRISGNIQGRQMQSMGKWEPRGKGDTGIQAARQFTKSWWIPGTLKQESERFLDNSDPPKKIHLMKQIKCNFYHSVLIHSFADGHLGCGWRAGEKMQTTVTE